MIWQDGPVTAHIGDALSVLREMPAESVHGVVTSPPYWGLRDYGTAQWEGGDPSCDHIERRARQDADFNARTRERYAKRSDVMAIPDEIAFGEVCGKCGARRIDSQLGLEATPEEYIARMVEVFREVRRVLRPDGTLWLNLGDSYWNGGGEKRDGGHGFVDGGKPKLKAAKGSLLQAHSSTDLGLKPKDLVGIPWRLAFALQADGWWLRSDIVWAKPNPMPESVTDRPTKAHEYVFMLTKSARYFYDAEAVREADSGQDHRRAVLYGQPSLAPPGQLPHRGIRTVDGRNGSGRNLRSVWTIATQPYPEAHFATFPEELARRCIAAGSSERGCCPECGAPWARVVERQTMSEVCVLSDGPKRRATQEQGRQNGSTSGLSPSRVQGMPVGPDVRTIGWQPTCVHRCKCSIDSGCEDCTLTEHHRCCFDPLPCTVLDLFCGSGTTLAVARRMGRRAVGIELQTDYLPLIQRRVSDAALPLLEAIG